MTPHRPRKLILITGMVCCLGCGASDDAEFTEEQKVHTLVASMNEAMGKPHLEELFFVEGSVPDGRQRLDFQSYQFWGKSTEVSGDTAKVIVEVLDAQGNQLPDVEWTAIRVDDRWKFKDIPLP